VHVSNAPAKDLVYDEKSSGGQKGEGHEPIRLRGGGGAGGKSDAESESSQDLIITRKGQILAEGSARDVSRTMLKELCIKVEKVVEEKPSVKEKEKERDRRGKSNNKREGQHKAKQRVEDSDFGEELPGGDGNSSSEGRSRSQTRDPKEKEIEEKDRERDTKRRCNNNKELEKEIKLLHEKKILRMTGKELTESLGIKPEQYTAEAEQQPTADIFNRLREAQTHILQVEKTSGNLKSTHQSALKINANLTLGLIEALRTRIDGNTEVETLRKRQEEQEESFKKMEEEMKKMRETIDIVLSTAETERRKAEYYQDLLQRVSEQKEELEKQLQLAREEQRLSCWEPGPEPMEIGEVEEIGVPATTTDKKKVKKEKEREEGGKEAPPILNPRITIEEELKTYPWIRPSIKGVSTIMEDKPHTGGKLRIVENRKVDVRTMTNEKGQQVAAPIIKKVNQIVKAKEAKIAKRDDEKRRMRDKPKMTRAKRQEKKIANKGIRTATRWSWYPVRRRRSRRGSPRRSNT